MQGVFRLSIYLDSFYFRVSSWRDVCEHNPAQAKLFVQKKGSVQGLNLMKSSNMLQGKIRRVSKK
ncbi:MAG: hypothetical protein ACXWC4_23535 [Telluria sp.]